MDDDADGTWEIRDQTRVDGDPAGKNDSRPWLLTTAIDR